jgi:hypothetical protein
LAYLYFAIAVSIYIDTTFFYDILRLTAAMRDINTSMEVSMKDEELIEENEVLDLGAISELTEGTQGQGHEQGNFSS